MFDRADFYDNKSVALIYKYLLFLEQSFIALGQFTVQSEKNEID